MRILLVAMLGLAAALGAQTVSGTVTNGVTHAPVAGVSVALVGPPGLGPGGLSNATTDAAGAFRIADVKPGDYLISANLGGFESLSALRNGSLHVEAGADPAPLVLTLMPWPNLSGRVLDANRRGVAKVSVTAIPTHGSTPWPVTTDSEGRYTFQSLAPARYLLLANPPEAGGSGELAPAYYPSAGDRADSQRVTVTAGADLAGYDIVLRGGPFYRVSGRVLDERGNPAAGATVRVRNSEVLFAMVTADAEGAFEAEHIPAMNGRVSAQWKRGQAELQGYTPLSAGRRDVERVEVRVGLPVPLAGTVELDGKPVAPGNAAYGVLEPADGVGQRAESESGPLGIRFEDAYAGRYRLVYYPLGLGPRSAYLDAVLLGDRDITMQEFDLAPGMQPVRVMLKTGGGQVQGTVENGEDVRVAILIPVEERLRRLPFIVQTLVQDGRFRFDNVRPGDYYGLALRGLVFLVDLQDPAYLAPLLQNAAAVHVEAKGSASVKLAPPR